MYFILSIYVHYIWIQQSKHFAITKYSGYFLCLGPVQRGSAGSRVTMENRTSGPWMTSTLASSVLTCVTDTAGVIMATAGQTCNMQLVHFFVPLSSATPPFKRCFVHIRIKVQMNKEVLSPSSLTGVMMVSLEPTASPPPPCPPVYSRTLNPRMHCSPHGKRW